MSWRKITQKIGPGIITGASDDDPSGILTYLQAGTVMGLQALWTALLTLPLMYSIQEMCGRLGMVTDKGLLRLIKEHYSRLVLVVIALVSVFAITFNLGADLLAVGVVLEKLVGLSRYIWLPVVAGVVVFCTIQFSYHRLARVLKWLTFSLFCYVIVVFFLHLDWGKVLLATIWPHFTLSKESILLVAAILGTTISPYLFFWQASEEVEERDQSVTQKSLKHFVVTKHELKLLKEDTFVGMLFSNVVTWFIIAGASHLNTAYGLKEITDFDQASMVLKPLLGNFSYLMFSLGIIGTALLAIPVLAGSVGYILAELFGWQEGMNKKFHEARGFYWAIAGATILGLLVTVIGFDPVTLLVYAAVFYAIITPPLVFLILHLANRPTLMRHKINSPISNVLGYATLIFSSLAVVFYFLSLAGIVG